MSRRTTVLAVGAALVAAASVSTLAACGGTTHHVAVVQQPAPVAAVAYTPNAYGENGFCYYIDDPQEAYSLISSGRCQPGWHPMAMPLAWHETYFDYYASPAYYNTYVPVSYRSGWGNQWGRQSTFYKQNVTVIINNEKKAVYKDNTGKAVAATAIPSAKLSFGSGVKPSISLGSVAPPKADNTPPASAPGSTKISLGGGVTAKQPVASAPRSAAPPPAQKPPVAVVPR